MVVASATSSVSGERTAPRPCARCARCGPRKGGVRERVSAGPDPHPLPPRLPPFPPDKRAKIMATALAANRAAAFSVREVESQGVGLAHQGGEGMATGLPPASRAGEDGERARSEKNSHPPPGGRAAPPLSLAPLCTLSPCSPLAHGPWAGLWHSLLSLADPPCPLQPGPGRASGAEALRGPPARGQGGAKETITAAPGAGEWVRHRRSPSSPPTLHPATGPRHHHPPHPGRPVGRRPR